LTVILWAIDYATLKLLVRALLEGIRCVNSFLPRHTLSKVWPWLLLYIGC